MKKIIVIEDDKVLREALTALLRDNGYEVCQMVKFDKVEKQIVEEKADLVLLDIILPNTNGQEILRNLRDISNVPVIMLTSKTGEIDEILAMSYGADDYIIKPYNPTLLLLKIEAFFRRWKPQEQQEEIEYRGVFLNPLKSTLRNQDKEIILSKNEISIFHYLLKHRGKIVSRDELMDYLWDCNDFIDDNTLTVNINRLRKKLEEIQLVGVIETRRRQGYILI